MTVVFGTGHRPEDTGVDRFLMSCLIVEAILEHPNKIDVAICGMAAGFDLAWGMEALNEGIEVWTVQPWLGHKPRQADAGNYSWLLQHAARRIVTNDSRDYPGPWVYQVRNEWMVDNADEGIAFWSGKESGGTFNCLQYAERTGLKMGKEIVNIYPE